MENSVYPSMRMTLSEREIENWIKKDIPDISHKDYWKIRNKFVNDFIPLEISIPMYLREKQVKKWEQSKDKHYYRVQMCGGGHKYVYMCEEMVKDFYGNNYQLVKG